MQPPGLIEENAVPHPLAGTTMLGSDIIMHVLAQEGTEVIFGYSGGAILPTYDAVFRYNAETNESMPLIVPANEQGAGFMASGLRSPAARSRHDGDVGTGGYQYGNARARLHGRFDSHHRNQWTGPDTCHWQ